MTEGVALHEIVHDENGEAADYRIIPDFHVHFKRAGFPAFESAHRRKDVTSFPIEVGASNMELNGSEVDSPASIRIPLLLNRTTGMTDEPRWVR